MVTGSPDKVIAAVKNGLTGQTTVNGKSYNGSMPAWKSKLSDAEIADVITYIRSSWGNKADAVTEAQVAGLK
jgi:mono/diheme cytochrome c family protein